MPKTVSRVPLPLKLVLTAYMALQLSEYLMNYGPTDFLYFCDVALLLAFLGAWIESSLLVSMCCIGILLVQTVWLVNFATHFFGLHLTPLTDYMFRCAVTSGLAPAFPLSWLAADPADLSHLEDRL
jgi:hypothetical protein